MSDVRLRRRRVILCGAVVALLGGCGPGENRADCEDLPNASSIFLSDTLQDWKSYADHLVILEVVRVVDPRSDTELPVARLRVDRVLWSARKAPSPPEKIEWRALPGRYEAGEVLLSPTARVEDPGAFDGPVQWHPLGYCSALLLEDGRVASSNSDQLRHELAGQTPEQVAAALRKERPDPIAERYRHLRPAERVKAVLSERHG